MRIALISDIHGNATALAAALDDIAYQHIDQIICLGDVAYMGPEPSACVERVRTLDCPVIMGNTDEWLIKDEMQQPAPADSSPKIALAHWGAQQLTAAERATMSDYVSVLTVPLDESHMLVCFHGSPHSNQDSIWSTTPEELLDNFLGDHQAAIYTGGHTHIQILRRHLDATFINPGSIGLSITSTPAPDRPRRYNRCAEYAILEWINGQAAITFRRVPYAMSDLRARVDQSSMPHTEWWLSHWPVQH